MSSEPIDSIPEDCLPVPNENTHFKLRIAGIFIILVTSLIGTLFPIFAKRSKHLHVPKPVFDFAKYFGSGIIIATAFIHLMAPAFESLGSECLSAAWGEYPWAPAIAMMSIFLLFIVEFFSFRWGTAKLKAAGFAGTYDQHGHDTNTHSGHGPEPSHVHAVPTACNPTVVPPPAEHHHHLTHSHTRSEAHGHTHSHDGHSHGIATVPEAPESAAVQKKEALVDAEVSSSEDSSLDDEWAIGKGKQMSGDAIAQILGISILEFGVIFHSFFIGLTLGTDPSFVILFIVIVFHQSFEGLGLGSRLAFLPLPRAYNWVPIVAGTTYAFVTPLGMAIGLAVRDSYQGNSVTALAVSGILDSISAGILLWTGLVELLAHEFLFSEEMQEASNGKVLYALFSMACGMGLMAVLGRWA